MRTKYQLHTNTLAVCISSFAAVLPILTASLPVTYFTPNGTGFANLSPASAMSGSWGWQQDDADMDVDGETITATGPDSSGNYCHSIEIVSGSNTPSVSLVNLGYWLHSWTDHSCTAELQAWISFAGNVKDHEYGHSDVNDDWNSESLAVEHPALGKATLLAQVYAVGGHATEITATEAKEKARERFEIAWDSQKAALVSERNTIHSQYHDRVGTNTNPDPSINCN